MSQDRTLLVRRVRLAATATALITLAVLLASCSDPLKSAPPYWSRNATVQGERDE